MSQQRFKTPQAALTYWSSQHGDKTYLTQPVNGEYRRYTFSQVFDEARRMATALKNMGLQPGDNIAIFSKNCAHWFMADFAIMLGGFVSVPVYPTANRQTLAYVLEHSDCKAIFVGKLDDWAMHEAALPAACQTIGFPYGESVVHAWDDLVAKSEPCEVIEPDPEQVMTLLYTSGSTGTPKGAVHQYKSFMNAGRLSGEMIEMSPKDRMVSYLPLAHCTERAYVESTSLQYGQQLWFIESLATFNRDLRAASPTVFGSVPRLWTQFQAKIHEKIPAKKLARYLKVPLLNTLLRNRIKRQMGLSHARYFISGSAPLGEKLIAWYQKLNIPVSEGWGLTETFAYGTLLSPGEKLKPGSIGKAGKGVTVKLAEDGEILIHSSTLMQEYYKLPEETEKAFSGDFFRTGDKGIIDDEGYVFITGRLKEIFKTAKGKYIAPAKIEGKLAENEFIEQLCVVGAGMTQPIALVQLNENAQSFDHELIAASLKHSMQTINDELEKHEKLAGLIVVKDNWTVETGLITPTLKIKRHALESKYAALLQNPPEALIFWEG